MRFLLIICCVFLFASTSIAREWKDNSGVLIVEAELVQIEGARAVLRKGDGTIIKVPIARLSKADKEFLESKKGDKANQISQRERIEAALTRPTKVDFFQEPLEDVVRSLRLTHGIQIILDRQALKSEDVTENEIVNLAAQEKSLESILDLVLRPLRLDWSIEQDVLMISSAAALKKSMQVVIYKAKMDLNLDETIKAITSTIAPDSWDAAGGPAALKWLPPSLLIVSQSFRAHREIAKVFDKQLSAVAPPVGDSPSALIVSLLGKGADDLIASLEKPVEWDFFDEPLYGVIETVNKSNSIEVLVDREELAAAGIDRYAPFNILLKKVRLSSALSILLKPKGCSWYVDKAGLHITTKQALAQKLIVVKYDVAALQDKAALMDAITALVHPADWDKVGGKGSIESQGNELVVKQSFNAHLEIADMIQQILQHQGK